MNNRKQRVYKFAETLLRKTGRAGGRGLGEFSPGARKALDAIAEEDFHKLKCACMLDWMNTLEALLVTCVKWAFNRPIEGKLYNDIPLWVLGRGTNTSPLCMQFVTDGDAIACEKCILDVMGEVCWLHSSAYMKTIYSGRSWSYLRVLLIAYRKAVKLYHYSLRKGLDKKEAACACKRLKYSPATFDLFKVQEDGKTDTDS